MLTTMWAQKLYKPDDIKKIKRGIGIKSEKIIETNRGQKVWKQITEWKELKDGTKDLLYLE